MQPGWILMQRGLILDPVLFPLRLLRAPLLFSPCLSRPPARAPHLTTTYLYLFLVVTVWVSRGVTHRGGCAQVLPARVLYFHDTLKAQSKNIPLEIKMMSLNRRQGVVFPVF